MGYLPGSFGVRRQWDRRSGLAPAYLGAILFVATLIRLAYELQCIATTASH
jgi:hypothetical protein